MKEEMKPIKSFRRAGVLTDADVAYVEKWFPIKEIPEKLAEGILGDIVDAGNRVLDTLLGHLDEVVADPTKTDAVRTQGIGMLQAFTLDLASNIDDAAHRQRAIDHAEEARNAWSAGVTCAANSGEAKAVFHWADLFEDSLQLGMMLAVSDIVRRG